MIVQLDEHVTAEVVLDQGLSELPRWHLHGLRLWLGPYRSTHQWVRHSVEALGSSDVDATAGTDELLFHREDPFLWSAAFIVPGVNVQTESSVAAWQGLQPTRGLLHLRPSPPFRLEPTNLRWFAEDGTALAGLTDLALDAATERLRLRIGPDVDLLFADCRFCGWRLSDTSRYLVSNWDGPHRYPSEPDRELIGALRRYMQLIADPNFELMEEGDTSILQALVALHAQLDPTIGATSQRRVIREAIEDVVDQFYDEQLSQQ